jgi:DNA-directed RNA polymerase subunit RPC12/RpoP
MVTVTKEISCSHCGAPLPVQPGEILITCNYCGFTSVVDTGKAFEFEHSLILNTVATTLVFDAAKSWMKNSFIAPKDLSKKSCLLEQNLTYLPFWVVSGEASSHYKGIFERISPAVEKEGDITNNYDWMVLARTQTDFPTRAYHLSLEGKIPFEATKIEKGAKVLNSEMTSQDAAERARDEINNLHQYLAKDRVDRIIEIKTNFDMLGTYYLHAPVWFLAYGYKGKRFQIIMDGASGQIIKGDLPGEDFHIV